MSTWLANRDRGSPHWVKRRTHIQGARLVSPLIARVLASETYYGDGAPTWRGAPASNNAKTTRKRYIKRLRRFASKVPEAAKLAKILARCKRRHRCMSGACPECGRAFQRWFVCQVMNLANYENSPQLTAVSIAFPHHRSVGDTLDTTKMKRDLTETIKNSDLVHWMAGGIDLSLNDDTQRNVPICWQAQLYGFAEVSSRKQFSKLLRDTFKKTRKVKRPIQTEECDGSSRAISYAPCRPNRSASLDLRASPGTHRRRPRMDRTASVRAPAPPSPSAPLRLCGAPHKRNYAECTIMLSLPRSAEYPRCSAIAWPERRA